MRHFYAFDYICGINCTTGEGRTLRVAGNLLAFTSKRERDQYCADNSEYQKPVVAIKRSEIPRGYHVLDAQVFCTEDQYWYPIHAI